MNITLEQKLYQSAAGRHWKRIGACHHHGINIPLFSLHSAKSCGLGEFTDLIKLFKWCREIGFDTIQLLPLNDTGRDTSPYNILSAFALNPMHLGLSSLPEAQVQIKDLEILGALKKLASGERVPYDKIRPLREEFLQSYFLHHYDAARRAPNYTKFLQQNDWLEPYAVYKTLKELNSFKPWQSWPKHQRVPSKDLLAEISKQYPERVNFHRFIQFLCFEQFAMVKQEAEKEKIFLKGDIPILISPDSADAWYHQEIFLPGVTAGAPPDMYSKKGQSWGFPVYDWEKIRSTNYSWWSKRLKTAGLLYHIYRLDHIVGFFRIWAIPEGKAGLDGAFIPSDTGAWVSHGLKTLLMMLESSPMLPIGEDLGIVPSEVRECMQQLGVCGTKVMRWERSWKEEDWHYYDGSAFIPESMTTVSTHDSTTLRQWWSASAKEAAVLAKMKGWTKRKILSTSQHMELLRDSHHTSSIFHINLLTEYLALNPSMLWPDITLERINTPGVISPNNWSCRLLPSVEEIVNNQPLKNSITSLIH